MKKFLKSQVGAATVVESVIVFPIIFFVLVSLIFISIFSLQKSALYSDAQRIANSVSNLKANAGYGDFGQLVGTTMDFPAAPTQNQFTSAISKSQPYRYWGTQISELDKVNHQFKKLVSANTFIFSNKLDCNISCKNNFVNQQIVVTINNTLQLPKLVEFVGLGSLLSIEVTAVASVGDPAEFVRNADLAFDFVGFLDEKFHFHQRFEELSQQFKEVFNKLK